MPIDDIMVSECPERRHVVILTLNRPASRNAMSPDMVTGLIAALESTVVAEKSAIIMRGAGKGFCAGSDIALLARMSPQERRNFEAESGRLARYIAAHPLPVIAEVHGFAIGGGLTLVAACDVVITTQDAKWSLPEVPIGLFPAWGLQAVAARTGIPAARRLAFGIDVIDGRRAVELGLADEITADPAMLTSEITQRFAAMPRDQTAAVKAYFAPGGKWQEGDARANDLFEAASASRQAKATFARFLMHRRSQ
jgi:enoyl-CoA hydratase/carnithine racemase